MKTVWVRHGQSEYNAQNLSTGFHDPLLTEQGVAEANQVAELLMHRYPDIHDLWCSDLRRSYYTANIISEKTQWPNEIKIRPYIRERDYGDWSGKNKDQIRSELGDEEFFKIRRGWNTPPKHGESLKDTAARVYEFLKVVKKDSLNQLPHIIVCHGNTIRAAAVLAGKRTPENVHEFEIHTGEIVEWDF